MVTYVHKVPGARDSGKHNRPILLITGGDNIKKV